MPSEVLADVILMWLYSIFFSPVGICWYSLWTVHDIKGVKNRGYQYKHKKNSSSALEVCNLFLSSIFWVYCILLTLGTVLCFQCSTVDRCPTVVIWFWIPLITHTVLCQTTVYFKFTLKQEWCLLKVYTYLVFLYGRGPGC